MNDCFVDEAVQLYKEGIYNYIELYIVPGTYSRYIEMWLTLEGKNNIPFIIHSPHFANGFNLAKKSCERANVQMYKEVRKFADKLNPSYIIFHGGIGGDIWETIRQLKALDEKRALIENKPFKVFSDSDDSLLFCRGYNPEEITFVLKEVTCGFCFDIGHAICAANSLKIEPFTFVKEFITLEPDMYHLTDVDNMSSEFDSHLHIGHGQMDIDRVLADIPSKATITIETIKTSKDNKLDDFIDDIKSIRSMWRK